MLLKPAIHIIEYAIDLTGMDEATRESLRGTKAFEEVISTPSMPFNEFSGIQNYDETNPDHTKQLEAYMKFQDAGYDPTDQARARFQSALTRASQRQLIKPEAGYVFLPDNYMTWPEFKPDADEEMWLQCDHAASVGLNGFLNGEKPDWQAGTATDEKSEVMRFYKVSAWIIGIAVPLSPENDTSFYAGPRPLQITASFSLRVDDAFVDPAVQNALKWTPYMGYPSPSKPPSQPSGPR